MTSKKITIILTSYVVIIGILVILEYLTIDLVYPSSGGFTKITPFSQNWSQLLWIMVIWISVCIVGFFFGGYLFGPIYLFIHKKVIGRKMIYGVQNKQQGIKYKGLFLKTLFPALLTVNLSLFFSYNAGVQELILFDPAESNFMNAMMTFVALLPITSGISIIAFSPAWFLLDGGILYSNIKKVKNKADPDELRSVGGWFLQLLKGYAGISIIISY